MYICTFFSFSYRPTKSGFILFNVKCKIQYRKTPIYLKIRTNCVEIYSQVSYLDKTNNEIYLNPDEVNQIDFDKIYFKSTESRKFFIKNTGKITFSFKWIFQNDKNDTYKVFVDNVEDSLAENSTKDVTLNLIPLKRCNLKNFEIDLQVKSKYIFLITFNILLF